MALGRKTGGRKAGTPNRLTTETKKALQMAFEGIVGVPALTEWARTHPGAFYPLWTKLLPKNIDPDDDREPLQIHIVRTDMLPRR